MHCAHRLKNPPIEEVVCGFIFAPTKLSSLDFGVYWEDRRSEYPEYELQPPVVEGGSIQIGGMFDSRVWLVNANEEILLQLQNDRFYVNWRRSGDGYPRFSDHENQQGLKRKAIAEFEKFAAFAAKRTSQTLSLTHIELSKIDVLKRGIRYDSMEDLRELLPITAVFEQVSLADPQQLQLRMSEGDETENTHLSIVMDARGVRIESRHRIAFSGDVDADFVKANNRVNQLFFGLLKTELFEGIEK